MNTYFFQTLKTSSPFLLHTNGFYNKPPEFMLLHMIMDQTAPAPPFRVLEVRQILECIWQRHHIDYEAECEFAWLLANLSKFKFQMWSSGSVPCPARCCYVSTWTPAYSKHKEGTFSLRSTPFWSFAFLGAWAWATSTYSSESTAKPLRARHIYRVWDSQMDQFDRTYALTPLRFSVWSTRKRKK